MAKNPKSDRVKWLKLVRKTHLYLGVVLGPVVMLVAVTGVYLVHKDDWSWPKEVTVSSRYLPDFYISDVKANWRKINAMAALGPDELLIGTDNGLHAVRGGEAVAAPVEVPGKIQLIRLISPGVTLIGTDAGLYRYDASRGSVLRVLGEGKPFDLLRSADGTVWLTLHQGGVRQSDDDGRTWHEPPQPLREVGGADANGKFHAHGIAAVEQGGSTRVLVATADGIFCTNDGGRDWKQVALAGQYVRTVRSVVTADEDVFLLAATRKRDGRGSSALWRSGDGGQSWVRLSLSATPENAGSSMSEKDDEIEQVIVSSEGSVVVTTKEGVYRSAGGPRLEWEVVIRAKPKDRAVVRASLAPYQPGNDPVGGSPPSARIQSTAFMGKALILGSTDGRILHADAGQSARLTTTISGDQSTARVPMGKLLTDLHSGKFMGGHLWAVYDASAVGLVVFVLSGLYLWVWPKWRSRWRARAMRP